MVSDVKASWTVPWPDYSPPEFTSDVVLKGPVWADPDVSQIHPQSRPAYITPLKFNDMDGNINRTSHVGKYEIHVNLPRYE